MNSNYRLLQLTNNSVGPVAVDALIPVGIMTRRIEQTPTCENTFTVTTSANNAVYVNEPGFYEITYQGYLTVEAAGDIVIALQVNGVTVQTATVTASAAGTFPVSISFITRAFNNCNGNPTNLPMLIQLQNTGVALTGGTSNLIIQRVSC